MSALLYREDPPSLAELARMLLAERQVFVAESSSDEDVVNTLFQQQHSKEQAQRITAVVIHALHRDDRLFDDYAIGARKKAFALADASMTTFYRQHGIDARKADFEKLALLKRLVADALRALDEATAQFISLETIDEDRNRFQRVLGAHRLLVGPLVPLELQRRKLKEVFDVVSDLRSEEGPEFVNASRARPRGPRAVLRRAAIGRPVRATNIQPAHRTPSGSKRNRVPHQQRHRAGDLESDLDREEGSAASRP